MIISVILISLFVKLKRSDRVGNQFFVIMTVFWSVVFIISLKPDIIDSLLNIIGFENRAQFLLSISIIVIIYLLYQQTQKAQKASTNLNKVIRKVALSNFQKDIGNQIEAVDVVIVIVAKDEEKTLGDVIEKIQSQRFSFLYKILVVNDGLT